MPAPTKTLSVDLLPIASVSNGAVSQGSAFDLSGVHSLGVSGYIARQNTSAHASPWAEIVFEGNPSATDNALFFPFARLLMPAGASIAQTSLNGAVSAAASTIVVTSATNIAVGALLFLGDASSANYEIVRVRGVSGTTLTIDGTTVFSHTTGAIVSSQPEVINIPALDVTGLARLRVSCRNSSGQSVFARVLGVTTVL
jgi:hypothetical protein